MTSDGLDPAIAAELRRLAALMLADLDALAAHLADYVLEHEQLGDPDDPTAASNVRAAARANTGTILSMLAFGVPSSATQSSVDARAFFERQAGHDEGLVRVLRTYRIGIAELWQLWAKHVGDHIAEVAWTVPVLAASTSFMNDFGDRMCIDAVDHWQETRQRRRRGLDRPASEIVADALFQGRPEGLRKLGYDPDADHLAVVCGPGGSAVELERLASRAKAQLAVSTVTLSHAGTHTVWFALRDQAPSTEVLRRLAAGVPIGLSNVNGGAAGFRTSYREASDAAHIGALRGDGGLTTYDEVALVSTLGADPERAVALIRRELGPILGNDERLTRLRATLKAFLITGGSNVRAAALLGVHEKTVTYRVRRAEELLQRSALDRRSETEAALLLEELFATSGSAGRRPAAPAARRGGR